MKLLIILLLLPVSAWSKDLYEIHALSEQEMLRTYVQMLREGCRFADRDWTNSAADPAMGYWGDGVSSGNEGIRAVAGMVLASGTLLKYDEGLSDAERRDLLDKATAALRYVAATHVTGTLKCPDGKHWGATPKFGPESWQSGMWTGTLACGAWLMWDKLDPTLQHNIERVVAWEDDILAHRKPPNGLWLDTKAEENGWEVPALVLGELMFPSNPHAAAWHVGALKYMMNTLCTAGDMADTNLVDGQPAKQWVGGANLQPDFTLENHNIFHPSYVGCSSYFMTQAALYYTYAGRPVPQAAGHHLLDTWRMFQTVMLPWGESAYPQGMDWELHGLPFVNLFATLAAHEKDALAARMEQESLQYMRAWQMMGQGDLSFPGSRFGITRHSINAEQLAYGFLAHKVFGAPVAPLAGPAAAAQEEGVWEYHYVDFIVHRTADKLASFSWKNRIMGMVIPVGEGHESSPEFTVPITNGLIGSFELSPPDHAKIKVLEHSWKKTKDGFETAGMLLVNGGRLRQSIEMISIGDRVIVYADRVTALTNVTVRAEKGVPIGIENDRISGGIRVLSAPDGEKTFDWKKRQALAGIAGSWANVDGRLGVVMAAGSGLAYAQAHGYSPGICVCADQLYGSYSDRTRQFKTGEEVARRVVVLTVEAGAKETAALAQSCKIESTGHGQILHFKEAGAEVEAPLF